MTLEPPDEGGGQGPEPKGLPQRGVDPLRIDDPAVWRAVSPGRTFALLMVPVLALSAISGALVLAMHLTPPEYDPRLQFWYHFFDVGREINVPTWFSAGLWFTAGLLAALLSRRARRRRRSWAAFAGVCLFLSLDETIGLHERLDVIGNRVAGLLQVDLGFTWVIPGALIAVVVVLALLRLVLSLPDPARRMILVAGAVFVAGGVGVETLAGLTIDEGRLPGSFFALTLLEETLEMTGVALCVAALASLFRYVRLDEGVVAYRVADRCRP